MAGQRRNAKGQQSKSELVYEAIAERWSKMLKDFADEKKSTMQRRAKREAQLHTLRDFTATSYGDLQGIAGRDLAEI